MLLLLRWEKLEAAGHLVLPAVQGPAALLEHLEELAGQVELVPLVLKGALVAQEERVALAEQAALGE